MKTVTAKTIIFLMMLLTGISFLPAGAQQGTGKVVNTLKASGYAPVNGLKMYYEIHGTGKPIVLVHGSYMTIGMNYGELIPLLAQNHKVIVLEMQGHGRTADINRPFSYDALASDIAGLLRYLKIAHADILGYSLGATVALDFAIKYPAMTDNLIFISSAYKSDGWTEEARAIFQSMKAAFLDETPLKTEYDKLAPDKGHWHAFVDKMVQFDAAPFDLGADQVKAVRAPVLMIGGDNDGVDLHHVADMYRLLGGGIMGDMKGLPKSRLAIIPGTSHVSLMMQTDKLMPVITAFLDKQ